MLNNAKPHFSLCVCYIEPIHTCITKSTATRKIILDAILLPFNFALLKWLSSVNSGLYRRYTKLNEHIQTICVTCSHSPMTSLRSLKGATRAISFVVYIFGRLFVLIFKTASSFCNTSVGRNCVLF